MAALIPPIDEIIYSEEFGKGPHGYPRYIGTDENPWVLAGESWSWTAGSVLFEQGQVLREVEVGPDPRWPDHDVRFTVYMWEEELCFHVWHGGLEQTCLRLKTWQAMDKLVQEYREQVRQEEQAMEEKRNGETEH